MQINVKVKANAKKNDVRKIDDLNYEVCTTATPQNGKANLSIIEILSKFFKIGKTKIKIVKGLTCKNKVFLIEKD